MEMWLSHLTSFITDEGRLDGCSVHHRVDARGGSGLGKPWAVLLFLLFGRIRWMDDYGRFLMVSAILEIAWDLGDITLYIYINIYEQKALLGLFTAENTGSSTWGWIQSAMKYIYIEIWRIPIDTWWNTMDIYEICYILIYFGEFEDPFPPAILALSLQYSSCEMAPLDKARLGSWDILGSTHNLGHRKDQPGVLGARDGFLGLVILTLDGFNMIWWEYYQETSASAASTIK